MFKIDGKLIKIEENNFHRYDALARLFDWLGTLKSEVAVQACCLAINDLLIETGDWQVKDGKLVRDERGAPLPLPERIYHRPVKKPDFEKD